MTLTPEQMELAERILKALQGIDISLEEIAKAAKQHREDNEEILGRL